jgi:hypothetical protein
MLVWTSLLLGKLEDSAILNKLTTDQTKFVLFNTKSYVCENSLFYFFRFPDPVLEGKKNNHFSQISCEKRI